MGMRKKIKLNGSFKETEGTDIAHGPQETIGIATHWK